MSLSTDLAWGRCDARIGQREGMKGKDLKGRVGRAPRPQEMAWDRKGEDSRWSDPGGKRLTFVWSGPPARGPVAKDRKQSEEVAPT